MVLKCHYSALLEYFNKYFAVDSPPPALENHTRDSCSGHFSSCRYHNWCFDYGLPPWSHGTHSSPLVWKIPWTEEPGGLQSMGSLSQTRLKDFTFTFHFHALEKEMATHPSVLAWRIPGTGEPGGLPSMGSHRVGLDWSDLAAAAAAWFQSCLLSVMLEIICSPPCTKSEMDILTIYLPFSNFQLS